MGPEVIGIIVLVGIFVISIVLDIELGLLALIGTWLFGIYVGNLSMKNILSGFPVSLIIVLIGITLLVGIAHETRTADWVINQLMRLTRGKVAIIPWVFFFAAALLQTFGFPGMFVLAAFAAPLVIKQRINPLLIALMIVLGSQGGTFSPIAAYGILLGGMLPKAGLVINPVVIWVGVLAFNFLVAAVCYFIFGGRELLQRKDTLIHNSQMAESGADTSDSLEYPVTGVPKLIQILTILGIFTMAIGGFLKLDLGMLSLAVSAVLLLFLKKPIRENAMKRIQWPVILLVAGILTCVSVMEQIGVVKWTANQLAAIGSPLVSGLLVNIIAAIISYFASSLATIGTMLPIDFYFINAGTLPATGNILALSISATIVDISPFSMVGAVVLALMTCESGINADDLKRRLLRFGAALAVIGPFVAWLIFQVILKL